MTFINAFFSSAFQRIVTSAKIDPKVIADALGYRDDRLVRSWMSGGNIPQLHRLAVVANAVGLPHEDLLLGWLCDRDPDNFARYQIIAAQLMGEDAADDLLSGADENSESPWWSMKRKPASAAEVAIRRGAPPGMYPDT